MAEGETMLTLEHLRRGIEALRNRLPEPPPFVWDRRELQAARKVAAILLSRIKPIGQWLTEHPRSASEIDLYHFVARGLREVAHG